jgi:hypothetical protein
MKKNLFIITAVCLLSACHHDNPLSTHTKAQSAAFLMNASANVEQRLQFAGKKGDRGYGYLECMDGKKNPAIDCQALYRGMVTFAKEGHYAAFESLTLADLNDRAVFNNLADDFAEILMSTEPTYYKGA